MSRVSHEGSVFLVLKRICQQLNGLSEGRVANKHNALTAAPTTGTYKQGDFIANSTPATAGAPGSEYIITGWICTVSGTPGTFKDARVLTGG